MKFHWKTVGGQIVVASLKGPPTDEELKELADKVKRVGGGRYIFADPGGNVDASLTARQRNIWSDFCNKENVKTVALTDRSMIRAIATAMTWITGDKKMVAYEAQEYAKALTFLQADQSLLPELKATVEYLRSLPNNSPPQQD